MRPLTEKSFRDADHAARLLGDMKHGIHDVKSAGGIDELQQLEALMGFRQQAEDILKNLGDSIGVAIYEINQETKMAGVDSDPVPSAGGGGSGVDEIVPEEKIMNCPHVNRTGLTCLDCKEIVGEVL